MCFDKNDFFFFVLKSHMWQANSPVNFVMPSSCSKWSPKFRFEIADIATKPVMDFVHVRRPSSFVRAFEITVETFLHFKIVIV